MLPYFRKAENNERGADEFHGAGGPLGVSDLRDRHPLAVAYVEAAVQCGYPRNDDFNGPVQEGAGYYQTTMSNGVRSSAAHGYLKAARRRANLKVVSKALATRILFDGRRATGVEYLVGNDKRSARANVEVIVASGAFNSPQLLQLSGRRTGVAAAIAGIPVVADAPGVGDDLNDHISGRIILRCKDADHAQRRRAQLERQAHPRLALRPHAPRLSRHPGGVFGGVLARAADIGNTRFAMLDFAVLGRHHRRRAVGVSRA